MGLFKSLKSEKTNDIISDDPDLAHTVHDTYSTSSEKRPVSGHNGATSATQSSTTKQTSEYGPPPDPHPSHLDPPVNPPPYHDWKWIPDTSLLPPPPSISQIDSPKNNASYNDAAHARAWCDQHPIYTPSTPSPAIHDEVQRGDVAFERPRGYNGILKQVSTGIWLAKTKPNSPDSILLSDLPLYFAALDSPLFTQRRKTIYFEVRILRISNSDSGLAIGYCAKPYPSWRLPGWHRASIGVHGDDGRRFINDSWGGVDFVDEFHEGDVVGIGVEFNVLESEAAIEGGSAKVEAFFTRNGLREGVWLIDEERDAERDEGIDGLHGESDMYAAVGVFGGLEFDIVVGMENWRYRGIC